MILFLQEVLNWVKVCVYSSLVWGDLHSKGTPGMSKPVTRLCN